MKVLYLTNMHNPYRDEFFEQLGRKCDLTVLFEQRTDAERDASWFAGEGNSRSYNEVFLPENERGPVSRTMLNMVGGGCLVVVGCYNSRNQMAAIERMRARRVPYIVNLDGPLFQSGGALKRRVRRHVLKGADAYLVAGETSVGSVRRELGASARVAPYAFTSLTEKRLAECSSMRCERDENLILCVGQFLPYKGIDVLLDAFAGLRRSELRLRVIGAGKRDGELKDAVKARGMEASVETVSFLMPDELVHEYARAGLLVLPSRQECWGLVVNEAAACGCPVVSTWGAGAGVEFLSRDYPQFLAEPDSAESLALAIETFLDRPATEKHEYSEFLRDKSAGYSAEATVAAHLALFKEFDL